MKKIIKFLSSLCGIGMLAAVGYGMYKAFNEMKAGEKGMPFNEFHQWWEETCNAAPNHIVKSVDCSFGYANKTPVVEIGVNFQTPNLRMAYGVSCQVSANADAKTKDDVVLTKSVFDDLKKEFDEQRLLKETPRFVDVFTSIYCVAIQNGKDELSEDDKEKIRNDVLDYQKKMVTDLQYISDEFDKLYEHLFNPENDNQ